MAPIYDKKLEQALYEAIKNHPLPVWIYAPGPGNQAVSQTFVEVLGLEQGGEAWQECVQNKHYVESCLAWLERADPDETWFHPMVWKRPDTGEILTGKACRASWIKPGIAVGEVFDIVPLDRPPLWRQYLGKVAAFLAGIFVGLWIGATL